MAVINLVVFDLNQTFYIKSSKEEFYKFILSKRPKRIRFIFKMIYYRILLKLHRIRQTEFKENFFNYLDGLPPEQVEAYAAEFWQMEFPENFNAEILQRLEKARSEGLQLFCATGALEVYVKPLFTLFPVDGFAGTKAHYNGKTYKMDGKACKGEEKIRRIKEFYRNEPVTITEAYSDKKEELFALTEKPYLVKNGKPEPFEKEEGKK
jgi:phosphoserine phosphatase